MIPAELARLARELDLDAEHRFRLRVAFGVACVDRVAHLLTDPAVLDILAFGRRFLDRQVNHSQLAEASLLAADLAAKHAGSGSLDGSGNAAVSTSHAVAEALAGRAIEAAEYAAYAKVYSYASYAVTDLANYADEHAWQRNELARLADSPEFGEQE